MAFLKRCMQRKVLVACSARPAAAVGGGAGGAHVDPAAAGSRSPHFRVNRGCRLPQRTMNLAPLAAVAVQRQSAEDREIGKTRVVVTRLAVVRVMKARQALPHGELMQLAGEALRHKFVLTARMFKDVVAELLEQDYLERDPADHTRFRYLA
jgi:hypothetical protein